LLGTVGEDTTMLTVAWPRPERELFAALLDNAEDAEEAVVKLAQRHRALLSVLIGKGLITAEEIQSVISERQAARSVDDLFDAARQERKKKRKELRDLLRGDGE